MESVALKESVIDATLEAAPINPDDVISGEPDAENLVIRVSDDARLANGVWRCTPGSFYLPHEFEETVTILAGHATVTPEGQPPLDLRAGDTVFFGRCSRYRWDVHETINKSWHVFDQSAALFG